MTDQEVRVRQATIGDVEALTPLFEAYRQFYGQTPSPARAREFLVERFSHAESILFVAEEAADSSLGFAQLYPLFSSVSLARTFVLNDLFVAPDVRRRGVGRALLRAAATFCKAVGAGRLSLSTGVTNTEAQALYAACGWTRQTDYYVYTLQI